jgi:hypothetical protein|tara:strand:- start:432 stop:689 length:258 start_codon:yes stop_codon:yes gene_type:complete
MPNFLATELHYPATSHPKKNILTGLTGAMYLVNLVIQSNVFKRVLKKLLLREKENIDKKGKLFIFPISPLFYTKFWLWPVALCSS